MKRIYISTTLSLILIIAACSAHKKTVYDFPEAMSENVRAEFTKQCDKGKALYEINCAGCHSKMVKGKMMIPDFSAEQLEAYQIRVTNPTHESRLSESQLTAEELGLILTFFSYKKKHAPAKKQSA